MSMRGVRTTITLADDVAAVVERVGRERDLGISDMINDLIRAGLSAERTLHRFRQETHDLGSSLDSSNIGETLETLDGPTAR